MAQRYNISPADIRGQCYDDASNMAGARLGMRSVVQAVGSKAMYFHCATHRLNLAVVSACSIQAFKNAESYVGEISRFFSFSARRQRLLDKAIEASNHTSKARKLPDSCRTRWVERIDSYAVFLDLLPVLHTCLQAMVDRNSHTELGTDCSWDGETITKANGFLFQLQSSTFLISFQILMQFFLILRELTIKLQMKAIDMVYAYKLVKRVVSTLESMRSRSTTEFQKPFTEATKLDPSQNIMTGLLYLVPGECVQLDEDSDIPEELTKAVELFEGNLPHAVMFRIEYSSWVREWKECSTPVPVSLADALQKCEVSLTQT
ncbi:Zinc finger MYM-type protein 1-like [Oopsacas minuta]|uniref:Zinc finger MYM-type protein 1-like n=1 Tax=Oopsacas minuta TaxID=111878 RepID=A0AAV7JU41_9METZ|nr:Zinc finger MYM-type protein 1-like [Oopsacas minuta]